MIECSITYRVSQQERSPLESSGGKSICLPVKERQNRFLPTIVSSVFCSPRFQLNNFVYSVVDKLLWKSITLQSFLTKLLMKRA